MPKSLCSPVDAGVAPNQSIENAAERTPDISVIIVSWNATKFLDECLESLSRGVVCAYEVIVVDNASTDGSSEMVSSKYPWVTLIQTGENLGFSKGNNIGIKHSRGKYVALVNSDVHVLPGCLDQLAKFLDGHSEVGMVGPRIMYGDRRLQSSCRRFPTLWNNLCEVLYLNTLFPRSELFAGEHMFYFAYDQTRTVEVLVGCFILARRDAINEFGLLDEDFFFYGEDLDWCQRCRHAGWQIKFFPGAEAIHYCGGSSAKDPLRFAIAQQNARLQLWAKHHSSLEQLGLAALIAFRCGLRLLAAVLCIVFRVNRRNNPAVSARVQVACLKEILSRVCSQTRGE